LPVLLQYMRVHTAQYGGTPGGTFSAIRILQIS
jgi:hypothetical protein